MCCVASWLPMPRRTRVQHEPNSVSLVQAQFEEVVAGAQRAELREHLRRLVRGELGSRLVGRQPHLRIPA